MLHFPKKIGNILQWSKFFKHGPINIVGVMLAVEVKRFIAKNACIGDVVQCTHDEMQ